MRTSAPVPSELVPCQWCGAKVDERCTDGAGRPRAYSHRPRVMLSLVGEKSTAAVARIEQILQDTKKRQTTLAETLAKKEG